MPHPPTLCLRAVYFTVSNCTWGIVTQRTALSEVKSETSTGLSVTFRQRGMRSPRLSRFEPVTLASVTPFTEVSMLSS